MADLFGAIVGAGKAIADRKAAQKTQRANERARKQGLELVANQDWEPELASQHAQTYQRSQSPIADAFLNSFLTGSNPAAVQGTRAGASRDKFLAQRQFNNETGGGWDTLRKQQAAMQADTPWAVKPFETPAIGKQAKEAVAAPGMAKRGLTAEDAKLMTASGLSVDPVTGLSNGNMVFNRPENMAAAVEALRRGDKREAYRLLDAKPGGITGWGDRR